MCFKGDGDYEVAGPRPVGQASRVDPQLSKDRAIAKANLQRLIQTVYGCYLVFAFNGTADQGYNSGIILGIRGPQTQFFVTFPGWILEAKNDLQKLRVHPLVPTPVLARHEVEFTPVEDTTSRAHLHMNGDYIIDKTGLAENLFLTPDLVQFLISLGG